MEQTLDHIPITPDLLNLVSTEQAWHYSIIPKSVSPDSLVLYAHTPALHAGAQEELELILGKKIIFDSCSPEVIRKTLNKYYLRNTRVQSSQETAKTVNPGQGDDFLPSLIAEARQLGSSDIHIECYEEKCRVRIRIDGMLVERYVIPKKQFPSLINKIKIRANLDIAEKRLPQDGRIFFQQDTMKFDIRVSVLPTLHGEKIVLRLLSNDATNIDLSTLGFTELQLKHYMEGVRKPHGIMLISGPTGSGKTTTLYATLKLLNKETTNIVTVEDPIEYTLEGINQVHLKESIGLTFASALRTFLRQDPDIIMLGEIRDAETAQMAIRAALTGHLVLSTIHTNSAWGTISRLADMGVPAFLISGTLNASVAQRLLRLLCPHCKQEQPFDPSLLPPGYRPKQLLKTHYVTTGCPECYYTGYRGRKAIYEIIPIDLELADMIKQNREQGLSKMLEQRNISTLSENAFRLFSSGDTSLDEVYPVLFHSYA